MKNRTFTINGVDAPCKRISKTPFVIARINGKEVKFSVYGKDITLIEGEVPDSILGELMRLISNYFSNNFAI